MKKSILKRGLLSLFALRFDSEQITDLLFNYLQVANFTARPRSIFVISWIYGIREIGNKQTSKQAKSLAN